MKLDLLDTFLNAITSGAMPLRIIFFGGVLVGFLIMTLLASVFGVSTHVGENTDLTGALVIGVSLMLGFIIAYSVVHIAGVVQQRRLKKIEKN